MTPKIDTRELSELGFDLSTATDELLDELARVVEDNANRALSLSAQAAPSFTGEGRGSIRAQGVSIKQSTRGVRIKDIVRTTAVSMVVQEQGRRPGATMPPVENIQRWVHLKRGRGQLPPRENADGTPRTEEQTAWLIARKIKHSGTPAKRFMKRAAEEVAPEMQRDVEKVLERFGRRVEGG